MPQALNNLTGPGKPLKAEAPDAAEMAGLLRTGLARISCGPRIWFSVKDALHNPREDVVVRIGRGRKASFCSQ